MIEDNQLKVDACRLAQEILKSSERYLENVTELRRVGDKLYGQCWNTEFHVFGVIESDTDHLPLEKTRVQCSAKMLEKSDIELGETIEFYRKDLVKACDEILLKYGNV